MVSSGSSAVLGPSAGVTGSRPGAVCVPRGGPSAGPGRRTLRSARPVKSGPRAAGDGDRPPGAADPGRRSRRKGCSGGPARAFLTERSALRDQGGLSSAGWPRVPPHFPLTRKIRFPGPFFTRSRKIDSGDIRNRSRRPPGKGRRCPAEASTGTRHIQVHVRHILPLTCDFPARPNDREGGTSTAACGRAPGWHRVLLGPLARRRGSLRSGNGRGMTGRRETHHADGPASGEQLSQHPVPAFRLVKAEPELAG